ncbi:histone methyltransferase set2 [Terramyces sp. JEL0728]|nr:histone methyltransferase set2 [Terramyces sp. JEL0728]
MSCPNDSDVQHQDIKVSEIKMEGVEDWMIAEVTGLNGQICASQQVLETVLQKYTHISNNIFKGGANGKIASEYMICDCRYDICNDQLIIATDHPEMACGSRAGCINRESAFVMEYCGEVISMNMFEKRTQEYSKNRYIDASKKGNVSRFMNHSCNPNCALQKWVVGNQIRIGIFAIKDIPVGTELTFDYQFEVAAAQKCHCGEENCVGYIGKGNSLTVVSEEDFSDDDIDNKKVTQIAPVKALGTVEQVQELVKYIMINLTDHHKVIRSMNRLIGTDVVFLRKFIYYRGLMLVERCLDQHINSKSNTVRYYILQVLKLLPITTKNGIVNIEPHVEKMTNEGQYGGEISQLAKQIIESWANLEMVYKIPKKIKVEGDSNQKDSPLNAESEVPKKRARSPGRNRPSPYGAYRSEDTYSESRYSTDRDKRSFFERKNIGNYEEHKITISDAHIPHLRWNVVNVNPPSLVETSSISLSAQTENSSFVDIPTATVEEMVEAAQEEIRRKEERELRLRQEAEETRKKAVAAKKQKIQEHKEKLKAVSETKQKQKKKDEKVGTEISTEERINLKSQITKALLEKELRNRSERGTKQTVLDEKFNKAIKKYTIDYLTRHGIITNK